MWRPTNETEETHDAAEDFHNEDLHEQVRVGSVRQSGRRAGDADTDTAQEVARANSEASPEKRIAFRQTIRTVIRRNSHTACHCIRHTCEIVFAGIELRLRNIGYLRRVNDANDL